MYQILKISYFSMYPLNRFDLFTFPFPYIVFSFTFSLLSNSPFSLTTCIGRYFLFPRVGGLFLIFLHCKIKLREIPMWTMVAENQTTWTSENSYSHFLWFCTTVVNIGISRIPTWLFLQCIDSIEHCWWTVRLSLRIMYVNVFQAR
jgi:hypothetical protein